MNTQRPTLVLSSEQIPRLPFADSSREKILLELWENWIQSGLGQLDRFLAKEWQRFPQCGKGDRRQLSDVMFRAVRLSSYYAYSRYQKIQKQDIAPISEHEITQLEDLHDSGKSSQWKSYLMMWDSKDWFAKLREIWELKEEQWVLGESSVLSIWPVRWNTLWNERVAQSLWSKQESETFLSLQHHRPRTWWRIPRGDIQKIVQSLVDQDITCGIEQNTLWTQSHKQLQKLPEMVQVAAFPMDWASQQLVHMLDLQKGFAVWDVCCGGGGKSLVIAEKIGKQGLLLASDLREYKLKEVQARFQQTITRDRPKLEIRCHDATQVLPDSTTKWDRILVDAPCSGSGTWRRQSDGIWRCPPEEIADLTELQLKILEQASRALKIGGKILYGTCSWFVQENEAVIDAFLVRNPEFECLKQQMFGNPWMDSDALFGAVLQHRPLR